ncbi:MAG: CDP-alcohol phosphatidyltransferase family protein [Clostridia bacterium]|nr:CDP-alcohol phosphatidyltransferase family protein [Clostridia bacterium]
MANILTGCRILGSILLLFFPVFTLEFYITYLFCGFSDIIDGAIARKTNSTSEFGSKIDTVADLVFVVVSLIKLLPTIHIPQWLWIWGGVIAIIKIGNIFIGFISKKALISVHTIMNKLTGLLLFLLPLTISFIEPQYSAIVVCSIATFSAIQESIYVMIDAERDPLPN